MDAKKCDRCGKYYDLYNTNNHKANGIKLASYNESGLYELIKSIDLCPECMEDAKKFTEGKQC